MTLTLPSHPEVWSREDIARELNVKPGTVEVWIYRSTRGQMKPAFPEPSWKIGNVHCWARDDVLAWSRSR